VTASARGLFRATGKTGDAIGVAEGVDLAGAFSKPVLLEREEDDFYPTPPEPTRALLAAEMDRLRMFPQIWEAAAGDGAMVREMQAVGLNVVASDMIDRGCGATIQNFYDFKTAPTRASVTNPPFAECNRDPGWVRHALENLDLEYLALLLPINWFGAMGRAALWSQYQPARVYVMRWRIDWTNQGASPILNCWVVWDKAWQGETALRMLDKKDLRQGELL